MPTATRSGLTEQLRLRFDGPDDQLQQRLVKMVYDGDGNRVAKTVGGVTTAISGGRIEPDGAAAGDGRGGEERGSPATRICTGCGGSARRRWQSQTISFYGYDVRISLDEIDHFTGESNKPGRFAPMVIRRG